MPTRTKQPTAPAKVPIVNVVRPVMQLRAGLDRVSTLVLREKMGFGFGVSQFRILYVLTYKPHITQKNIADFWDVTEASVSRQVGILEKRGFVRRESKLTISPAGRKALDKAMKYATDSFEEIFKDISSSDRKTVAAILEKLIDKIKISPLHTF